MERADRYDLIEHDRDLEPVVAELRREPVVAVDLEADSMFHFREKVCLLQISTPSRNILIDPIEIGDLSPLAEIFSEGRIRKIFHGADYDIRSLHRSFGFEVESLFDTQIAARFLGLKEISLAGLLREKLGVGIEKKYQKKDWSKRPISPEMLSYAVQDACYLIPLASLLLSELRSKNRVFCVEEECRILTGVRPAPPNHDPLFLKFKGAAGFDRRSLAVLEAVLQVRLSVAEHRDRPPFKVMGEDSVLEITESKPVSERAFSSLKRLSPRQKRELGQSIIERVKEAMSIPEELLPTYPKKRKRAISQGAAKRAKALKDLRERFASKLGIDPSLVLTTAQIKALAVEKPGDRKNFLRTDGLKGWQVELFGRDICHLLKSLP